MSCQSPAVAYPAPTAWGQMPTSRDVPTMLAAAPRPRTGAHPAPAPPGYPATGPTVLEVAPYAAAWPERPRFRTTAALLALVLGGWGAHCFYRGQTARGWGHVAVAVGALLSFIIAVLQLAGAPDSESVTPGFLVILCLQLLATDLVWSLSELIAILLTRDGSLV